MRAFLTAATFAIAATLPAQAATFGVHLFSQHESSTHEVTNLDGSTYRERYNNRNLGVYYVADNGITVGAYRNSYFANTFYAGYTWHFRKVGPFEPAIAAVLATGYERLFNVGVLRPVVMPSVAVQTPLGVSVRYFIGPAKGGVFQHVAIERKF